MARQKRCMAIHRKILSTDKKYCRKFAAICRRSTESGRIQSWLKEIELKFIVAQDGVETLREQLNALEAKHTPAGQLLNIYYENRR